MPWYILLCKEFSCIALGLVFQAWQKPVDLYIIYQYFVFCYKEQAASARRVNIYCCCKQRHLSLMTLALKVQSNAGNINSDSFLKQIIILINLYMAQIEMDSLKINALQIFMVAALQDGISSAFKESCISAPWAVCYIELTLHYNPFSKSNHITHSYSILGKHQKTFLIFRNCKIEPDSDLMFKTGLGTLSQNCSTGEKPPKTV